MLRRLGHGCWSNASTLGLLRSRRSTLVGARSVGHLVAGSGGGDVDPSAASASPAAATNARRAKLFHLVLRRDESIVADAKTVADCRTFAFGRGGQLRVCLSLALAPPPAESSAFLYYDWGSVGAELEHRWFPVLAAHGDSVLFAAFSGGDCFVYRAGAATRPPSLSQLLHGRDVRRRDREPSNLFDDTTGLLRRSEDHLLVAQLELTWRWGDVDRSLAAAEVVVWVLHAGMREWELKPAIIVDDGDHGAVAAVKRDKLLRVWSHHKYTGCKVVPVGDRFLCWVDMSRGFALLCDMAAAEERGSNLRLCYVPLPMAPADHRTYSYSDDHDSFPEIEESRDIRGVVVGGDNGVGGGALRFVSVDLRCCCCARSSNAFLVTTWTLALRADGGGGSGPMAWVKDAALDCEELWALPGYDDGLPRVPPWRPVVSSDNPDVVCFSVAEMDSEGWMDRTKVWMVEVDMRKKEVLSVVRCTSSHDCGPHYINLN